MHIHIYTLSALQGSFLFLVIDAAFSWLFLGSSKVLVVGAQAEWYEIVIWTAASLLELLLHNKVLHILDR